MKTLNNFIFILFIVLLSTISPKDLFANTANDFSTYIKHNDNYAYGSNMGYFGSHFTDQNIAELAYNAGARTIRASLPDWLITGYGINSRSTAFQFYKNLGITDLAVFVGEPNDPSIYGTQGPDNRETIKFPGASERAKTFKGLYEPVWLDSAKTQINSANTYANYLYKTVKEYGQYVKFWEIVNEPDFTYTPHGWQVASADPKSWWNVNPEPEDLTNLKAPIQYYVRELRVAWDVIKTLQPNSYVATGGIGYASFLDALLRNTDNPVDGSVTSEYPLKAGAYFDVLSFHTYPMYKLSKWDNTTGGFVYSRHSDRAADVHIESQKEFQTVLEKYNYNGSTYPKKQWLVTETDIPQETVGTDWGGVKEANNYILKAHILGQVNEIMQTYKYGLAQNGTKLDSFNRMGMYGDVSPSSTTVANAPKTEQYKAINTISKLLYGKKYDATKTSQLNFPSTVRGAAFVGSDGKYTYALWAKTTTDLVENVSGSYSFPFTFNGIRYEWDYSSTNQSTNVSSQNVDLTSSPSFFTETSVSTTTPPIVIPPTNTLPPVIYNPPTYIPPYSYTPPQYIPPTFVQTNTNNCTNNIPLNINCDITRTLKYGMKNSEVTCLQQMLSLGKVTGYFGKLTKAGVIAFQINNNLNPDGVFGPRSRSSLMYKKQNPENCASI